MIATASKCQQMKAIESKRQRTLAKANKTPPEACDYGFSFFLQAVKELES